jgi:hypothetical protein
MKLLSSGLAIFSFRIFLISAPLYSKTTDKDLFNLPLAIKDSIFAVPINNYYYLELFIPV